MSDLISRQAVINCIANTCFWMSADNWDELMGCIGSIPSADTMGEWKPSFYSEHGREIYNCSRCGESVEIKKDQHTIDEYSFCPYCGATMKGRN